MRREMLVKKAVKTAAAALTASVLWAGTAYADWVQDGTGWWYQNTDGSYPSGGLAGINGANYYFDGRGYMQTGWQYINYRWYYFDGNGAQAMGWRQLDGKWYYLDPAAGGVMRTGWMDLNGQRYYMDENGVMQTGIFYPREGEYGAGYAFQADPSGALMRSQTVRQGRSRVKYGDDGKITFRNPQTEEDNKRYGTDVWQPLLNQDQLDEKSDDPKVQVQVYQNELWELYEDEVKKANKAEREEALEAWKDEVYSELEGYMTESEIEAFIHKVIEES